MPSWIVTAGRVGLWLNLASLTMNAIVFLAFSNQTSLVMALINAAMILCCLRLLP